MSDIIDHIKKETIMLTASPVKHEVMGTATVDVPSSAYRKCNPPYSTIGNSLKKQGITKLSARGVKDDVGICPVILHPTKQLTSPVKVKTENLLNTIEFSSTRSQLTTRSPGRIVPSSLQRSIMESQNITPLLISPKPIHTKKDIISAKIVPFPPASHFSKINKSSLGSYDNLPIFTSIRPSLLSGTPPIYTQSDFARFPSKSYQSKSSIINSTVVHSSSIIGSNEELCLNISNNQHLFKPIISPRPSILRKRDADGLFRSQKHLLPIIKPDPDDCQNMEETSVSRNGFIETSLQIESIMVPRMSDVVLPQMTTISRQSRIMVEISPRKKPRKQLLPVNQDNTFQIINDEMEYVGESIVKIEKTEYYQEEIAVSCNVNAANDIDDDDFYDDDDMDMDDDFPGDDYDIEDDFENDFPDGLFEYDCKPDKLPCLDIKPIIDGETKGDENKTVLVVKRKRPTLLAQYRTPWRGQSHHFQRYTDFKIKEVKKPLTEHQLVKKWMPETRNGWRIIHMLKQFDGMVNAEEENIQSMIDLKITLETQVTDVDLQNRLFGLIEDNVQRSAVARGHLEDIIRQLKKILDYRSIVDDIVEQNCPKDLIKKYPLFLDKR